MRNKWTFLYEKISIDQICVHRDLFIEICSFFIRRLFFQQNLTALVIIFDSACEELKAVCGAEETVYNKVIIII